MQEGQFDRQLDQIIADFVVGGCRRDRWRHGLNCKIWYSISQTVSEDDVYRDRHTQL